jgi:hypothetical protein
LRFAGSKADAGPLAEAFSSFAAPFDLLDIGDERVRAVYGCDLLLVRPDLHVVWRGNRLDDPIRLAAVATGH